MYRCSVCVGIIRSFSLGNGRFANYSPNSTQQAEWAYGSAPHYCSCEEVIDMVKDQQADEINKLADQKIAELAEKINKKLDVLIAMNNKINISDLSKDK